MPYPAGHKLKVRGRIIESAAKAFRSNGIREISVPAIMKGAGLTHGGFYSHFDSKDQLVCEACSYAVEDTLMLLRKAVDEEQHESKIHAIIDYYLSAEHRDNTELGCILPAFTGEMPRLSDEVRKHFTDEVARIVDFICATASIEKSNGTALLSLLIGTILMARSVNDPVQSDSILDAGKSTAKELLGAWQGSNSNRDS
ncbi:TetR/AcrR family transcriptional regulator [Paenibacillus albus]|uniref:TetR/AcrR family transcriptional regulator n=1 Tax=Paenibacillus albus TaxID=2495582 RepID=A0A3Q8XA61_9BACL|nr:TetR/AcrR family transcriptional regulator [Paenibacillus albus]AZN43498.1 TetR/AcrR family transcriptional regulator [Paenibacillus albus]